MILFANLHLEKGLLEIEAKEILQSFFKDLRKAKKDTKS